jgi:hypothetical protein
MRLHVLVAACMLVACSPEHAATPYAGDASVCTSSSTPSQCMADSSCYAMCPPTWSAALADRAMCIPSCGYQNVILQDCGQYQAWWISASDCSYIYYYEKSSGALVARFFGCNTQPVCDFGPPGFTQPASCGPFTELYPCNDAGADGG